MYQVLVNIEKSISDVNEKKIVENVTVTLKKKVSPDNNSEKFKRFFLILTLENVKCVSWYMIK